MTYELAKELKEAGFPQYGEGKLAPTPEGLTEKDVAYIPTLSELIEACGDTFKKLWKHSNGIWSAHYGTKTGRDSRSFDGSTPEEAVARLWLALNKK